MFVLKWHLSVYLKLKSSYITNLELSWVYLVDVIVFPVAVVSPLSCCIRTVLCTDSYCFVPSIASEWHRNNLWRVTWLLALSHMFTLPVTSHLGGYWLFVFLRNSLRVNHVITVAYLVCFVTCKRQVCLVFTCCCIATETCEIVLLRVSYWCLQHVGGFHGRLPHHILLWKREWESWIKYKFLYA
jgi:hypothetical protein